MSNDDFVLRLSALPLGRHTMSGGLRFELLDSAEETEPFDLASVADIDNLGARIHVRVRVQGRAQSTCHRCLGRFERPVEAEFELTLQKRGEEAGENFVSLSENDVEYDLAPNVREAVILEEPIQLLCDPGCRGLCSRCGADLNVGPCGCRPAEDPRWAPLEDLRRSL